MKTEFPEIIFNRFGLYHIVADSRLSIISIEDKLLSYLGPAADGVSRELCDIFPEIYGLEHEVAAVIEGRQDEFKIHEINRSVGDEIFFNIIFYPYEPYGVLVLIEDITREIRFRQSLQQNRNEIQLLQHKLIDKNNDLENTNFRLIQLHDEMKVLNNHLEQKVRDRTREIEENNLKLKRLFDQTVTSLTRALEKRDEYTAGHQQRVSSLSCAIALEMGLSQETIEGIKIAGNLHDIGKIYVPIEFLTKPGTLSIEEFTIIKMHPKVGFEILKDIEFEWPVALMVLQHHERMDGSGYPYGIDGNQILFESKILAVADIVEAMATNRPYRISPGLDTALSEISDHSGTLYDEQIVEACIYLMTSKNYQFPEIL